MSCKDVAEPMPKATDNTEVDMLDSPGRSTMDTSMLPATLPPVQKQPDTAPAKEL